MKVRVTNIQTEKMKSDEIAIVMRCTEMNTMESLAALFMNSRTRFTARMIATCTASGVEVRNKKTNELVATLSV